MTLFYMSLYEIKNKLRFSAQMLVTAVLAVVVVFGMVPVLEQVLADKLTSKQFSVAFADEEDSAYTRMIMETVLESAPIKSSFQTIAVDRETAMKMLENNEVAAVINIPEGFTRSMRSGEFKEIKVILNPKQPLYAELVKGGMESGGYLMSAVQNALYTVYAYISKLPISEEQIDKIFNREMFSMISYAINIDTIYERELKTPWQDMEVFDFYSISIILFFMTLYSAGMIYQWHESEENKLNGRMKFVCRHASYVVYANVFAGSVIIFIQALCMFLPLFLFRHGLHSLRILPCLYLISLNISAIVILAGNMVKKTAVAVACFAGFEIFSALASGTLIPFYFLPEFIPSQIKIFTLNYHWQQMLISAFSNDTQIKLQYTMYILGFVMFILILLGGMTSEKLRNFKSRPAKQ